MILNTSIIKKNNPELIYLTGLTILAKEKLNISLVIFSSILSFRSKYLL